VHGARKARFGWLAGVGLRQLIVREIGASDIMPHAIVRRFRNRSNRFLARRYEFSPAAAVLRAAEFRLRDDVRRGSSLESRAFGRLLRPERTRRCAQLRTLRLVRNPSGDEACNVAKLSATKIRGRWLAARFRPQREIAGANRPLGTDQRAAFVAILLLDLSFNRHSAADLTRNAVTSAAPLSIKSITALRASVRSIHPTSACLGIGASCSTAKATNCCMNAISLSRTAFLSSS
jgi:hypothetical protein